MEDSCAEILKFKSHGFCRSLINGHCKLLIALRSKAVNYRSILPNNGLLDKLLASIIDYI